MVLVSALALIAFQGVGQNPWDRLPYQEPFAEKAIGSSAYQMLRNPDRIVVQPVYRTRSGELPTLVLGAQRNFNLNVCGPMRPIQRDLFAGITQDLMKPVKIIPSNCAINPDFLITWISGGRSLKMVTCFGCGHLSVYSNRKHLASAPLHQYPSLKDAIVSQYSLAEQLDISTERNLPQSVQSLLANATEGIVYESEEWPKMTKGRVRGTLDSTDIHDLRTLLKLAFYSGWGKQSPTPLKSTGIGCVVVSLNTSPPLELHFSDQSQRVSFNLNGKRVASASTQSVYTKLVQLLPGSTGLK